MTCGVYQILNCITGRSYIGQSQDIETRMNRHRRMLNSGQHHCKFLQNSWNKHSADNFIFRIIDEVSIEELDIFEQKYLDIVFENGTQYNDCRWASSCRGVKRSEETREKIRIASIGRKLSDETREKLRAANAGKTLSDEHRALIGVSNTGKKHSAETREKLRAAKVGKRYAAKLCVDDVAEIRALLAVPNRAISQRKIARDYGITPANLSLIKLGLIWKNGEAA